MKEIKLKAHSDFVEKGRGGYYSPLNQLEVVVKVDGDERVEKVAVKQWGNSPDNKRPTGSFMSYEEVEQVIKDVEAAKEILASVGIRVPKTLAWKVINDCFSYKEGVESIFEEAMGWNVGGGRIVAVDEFAGTSIRDLNGQELIKAVAKAREAIALIPEGMELDVHPGNFVWDGEEVYFVDFMPPKIWGYRGVGRMEEIFPTISEREGEEEKKFEYLTLEGRLSRFDRYLKKWCEEFID